MATKEKAPKTTSHIEAETQALLKVLGMALQGFSSEVKNSSQLLEVGAKTGLVVELQENMENPLKAMVKGADLWDENIKRMIDDLMVAHFVANRDLLITAHKQHQTDNFYYVVLKEDNEENRSFFFDIVDGIENVASKFPIHIQFVPESLIGKLASLPKINLHADESVHFTGKA
ncbi:MAG: hypothetical protein SFW35_10960 [Chitinophagales bacterium]|nr:hypothetical protein [Chitinophagales bacterium]